MHDRCPQLATCRGGGLKHGPSIVTGSIAVLRRSNDQELFISYCKVHGPSSHTESFSLTTTYNG